MENVMVVMETASQSVKKTPIGQILLSSESIISHDLEFALEHQKNSRELIGEILIRMGALERENLEMALALQCALFVD